MSKNAVTIAQLEIACRHVIELMHAGMTENLAIRNLELFANGYVWQLSGSIAAGQSRTINRDGMAMTLNNDGDEIRLLDATNAERDRFEYTSSTEGVVIQTGH